MSFALDPAIKNHKLFDIAKDIPVITSPSDVGYHPDSELSTFEFITIRPDKMAKPTLRGPTFIAIRCAPINSDKTVDQTQARVECAYFRRVDGNWSSRPYKMCSLSPMSNQEFADFSAIFASLAAGKEVVMHGKTWIKA